MKFPKGTDGGTISNPQDEGVARELMSFVGAIEIETGSGHGFMLADQGTLIAAYFRSDKGEFRAKEALSQMAAETERDDEQCFSLRIYSPAEFSQAVRISEAESLLLAGGEPAPERGEDVPDISPTPPPDAPEKTDPALSASPRLLDEARLRKIMNQPGVIAVSAFFEGFPVQSLGDEDFEHVAASAEDFMRAGSKIAHEMKIGDLDQMILETAENKFIIAPCGDLYLCIFTTADAQLGLIRVVLRSIQKEINS
ncbi:MAG: roadblock/LC7 domain-containing protein [Methanoregula sp.]|jgi:predicted regulator of Ras-like GTPase activity (Roadblock/LC7/MglB family)|uniref:roadblock/LC7 domain-containing protein n=1 Tax=Methanoregula sp. TaxID=2052170 RepID=UPI0025CD7018|nr:roadblock/LC7 domain-containing protein [Methanoregula sp.]MCK9630072.1 roadblock/LC7 domain-containing protein [Methanoregula sp.]